MLRCQDQSAAGSPRPLSAVSRSSSSSGSSGSSGSTSPFRMIHCRRPHWNSGDDNRGVRRSLSRPISFEAAGDGAAAAAVAAALSMDVDDAARCGGNYSQMPMRAFMSPKDWRQLLSKRDSGKLVKCKLSRDKYSRMLYSYHRLYQEYQYICTCLLPRSRPNCRPDEKSGCNNELLIGLDPADPATSGGAGSAETSAAAAAAAGAAIASGLANVSNSTTGVPRFAFGSVLMADRNFKVQSCKKRCSVISHRVLTRTADGGAIWLEVPIVVELLLPRLQEQIKAVMAACPHVSDPLEVLAELRVNRYDTERCVEYLRKTLPLREVVRDILSVRFGSRGARCDALAQPPIPAPAVLDGGPLQLLPTQAPTLSLALQPPAELLSAAPPAEPGAVGWPLLSGVRRIKDDIRVVRSSLRSVAAAMAAGLGKIRCHLSVQQERMRRLSLRDGTGAAAVAAQQQTATLGRMQKCVEELRLKCKEEEARRRLVFNALQEQLGNIRVYCRCTRVPGDQSVETVGAETVRMRGQIQQHDEYFRFDRVFGPDAPQESLFDELQPLITSFLDGYNVCFITYGGEASGKTFTLLGSSKQRGLVYRALLAVLKEAGNRESDWQMELDSTCLEIYNDACFDLLASRSAVSLYKDCGLSSVFAALQRAPIREEKDVTQLLRVCSARRRVAKTALNPKSSRSHLINLVRLQAKSRVHGHTICSYLGMMDLAGAENIVKADTWRDPERAAEAGHINRSLAAFNRLFLTLRRTPPSAACYREARLTQMLKPFLVNHGKCCIIVTVRTDQGSTSTTMSTLRFGRDTRQVALGKAQRQLLNVD